jgi:hypothetical protein
MSTFFMSSNNCYNGNARIRELNETTELAKPRDQLRSKKSDGMGPRPPTRPISTTDKQSMAYVTTRNIETETSYLEKDWPLFVLKELLDNAFDWLNDYYPAKSLEDKNFRRIGVKIEISENGNDRFVHISVRNSNPKNIPAFENLSKMFDFYSWHSTKRNQHRMTTGSLGDALKRCLGMGYAIWTYDYNPDETLEEKQWDQPAIIRRNGKETKIFIKVDNCLQRIWAEIEQEGKPDKDMGNDTEVEITLPLPRSGEDNDYWIGRLKQYFDIYKIGKSRTIFTLEVTGR